MDLEFDLDGIKHRNQVLKKRMCPFEYKKNVFIHDCVECEESYIESCDACLSNPNPIKDPHACRCAILSYCKVCCELSGRIKILRESLKKLEESRAPESAIKLAQYDLANMLEAINSFDA